MKNFFLTVFFISFVFLLFSCEQEKEENIYEYPDDYSNDYNDKTNGNDSNQNEIDENNVVPDEHIDENVNDPDELPDEEEKEDIRKTMVLVPEGYAWVGCNENIESDCPGNELPYHQIYSKAFYIDKFEVTVEKFKKCIKAKACGDEGFAYDTKTGNPYCNLGTEKENHPMNCVSYFGAAAYCLWVGKRLPSEGEWEKAARGGCEIHGDDYCEEKSFIYTWGNEGTPDCSKVNMASSYTDWGCGTDSTSVGGSYQAGMSMYGTYDQLGNLYEWVDDKWSNNHDNAKLDGSSRGVASSDGTVKGGGFMQSDVKQFRISYRAKQSAQEILYSRGFRCVADISE